MGMKKGLMIALGVGGLMCVIGLIFVVSLIGMYNGMVRQENGLQAQYDDNRNDYDAMFKSFQEAAQVPEMYKNDLREVYDGAIKARYGAEGSKALFQFIKEHNPNFSDKLYTNLQSLIEARRTQFEAHQTSLLDKKRVYLDTIGTFPNSLVAGLMGFPRIDLKKIDIVTSGDTEKAFDTKQADSIRLRATPVSN